MNCKFCGKILKTNGESHQSFCLKNPNRKSMSGDKNPMKGKKGANQYSKGLKMSEETKQKIANKNNGNKLSEEIKNKISKSMIKAHEEKRAWNIGKSRWNNKESYPEKFFMKVIENEFLDKNYKREYPFWIYSIDFAWVEKRKAIEIDGEQHERFQEYKDRDIKKDQYLLKNDWKVIRIKWKDMYKNPKLWIEIAYKFIHDSEA